MIRWVAAIAMVACLVPQVVFAASLASEVKTSFRDMHRDTDFGAWFLIPGAFRSADARNTKKFGEVGDTGEIEGMPDQRGFCFAMNNFDPDRGGAQESLTITLIKTGKLPTDTGFVDRTEEAMPTIPFLVTADMVSKNFPLFCISALTGVETLEISIAGSSQATERSWSIRR